MWSQLSLVPLESEDVTCPSLRPSPTNLLQYIVRSLNCMFSVWGCGLRLLPHQTWKIPWRREWQPTPVFLPEGFLGQRSLAGYSPRGRRVRHDWETDTFTSTDQANCVQMCTNTAQRPRCPLHSLLAWGSCSLLQPVPVELCLNLTVSTSASLSAPGIPGSQWPWQWLGLPVVQGCAAQLEAELWWSQGLLSLLPAHCFPTCCCSSWGTH